MASDWVNNLAKKLENSQCTIHFISENYDQSQMCRDEMRCAMHVGKHSVNVYLEDVQLTPGLSMQVSTMQSIHLKQMQNDQQLVETLARMPDLKKCR